MSDDEIVWEEPVRIPSARGKWITVLAPLMERPGVWARIKVVSNKNTANNAVGNLRRVNTLPSPHEEWEFTYRKIDEDTLYLYARYIGNGKP